MTDLRQAAQQALEALEQSETTVPYEGFGMARRVAERKHQATITNLRAALAQQAEPTVPSDRADSHQPPGCDHCNHPLYAATKCRVCGRVTEQAEPVEPVAYVHRQGNHWEVSERHLDEDEKARGWTEEPLYTAPPQRKPLPNHDQHCVDVPGYGLITVRLVRAVERAHGIKE